MKKQILAIALLFCLLFCTAPSAFAESEMTVGTPKWFSVNPGVTIYSWTGNSWRTSDPSVVSLSPDNTYYCKVTPLKAGRCTISARVSYRYGNRGQYSDSVTASWDIVVKGGGGTTPTPTPQPTKYYTIRYYANGGSGAPSSQSKQEGTSITLSTTQPTWEGYIFQGWATSSTSTTVSYKPGDTYSKNSDLYLYAVWKFDHYVIKYDANSGSGAPSSQSKNEGKAIRLSSTVPKHSDSTGSYIVTLDANGGSVSQSSLTSTKTTSYTFKNWNTSSDGSGTSYQPGASYSTDASVTLYAQWDSTTTVSSVMLPTPKREGWNFQGWATDRTALSGTIGSYTPTRSITLYAVWECEGTEDTLGGEMHWHLDNRGCLTVTGTGPVVCYPWDEGDVQNSIKTVIISEGLTRIDDWGFDYCKNITSVTLPQSVRGIGHYAFRGCEKLASIEIPDGVTTIGSYAFSECANLTAIDLPNELTAIENGTFDTCSSLISIKIPDHVKTIGDRAFSSCTALTNVSIPYGVTNIGDSCFSQCKQLTSVKIPGSVQSLSEQAFYLCSGLRELNIQEGVQSILDSAFSGCDNLNTIRLPATLQKIENGVFYDSSSLRSVYYTGTEAQWRNINIGYYNEPLNSATIYYNQPYVKEYTVTYNANGGTGTPPNQTKTAGKALTLSSTKPTHQSSSENYTVTFNANSGSVSPQSLSAVNTISYTFRNWNTKADGSGTSYGSGANYSADENATLYAQWNINRATEAVTLPTPTREGCIFVGWATSASADSGITGRYTPSGNVTLYAIWKVPYTSGKWGALTWTLDENGLLRISGSGKMDSFSSWSSQEAWRKYRVDIRQVLIQTGITSIGVYAFSSCSNLTAVEIPSTVTEIEKYAFEDCYNLRDMEIPPNVTSIGNSAFSNCSGLTSVRIPSGVKDTGGWAFRACEGLTSLEISFGVTKIGFCSFSCCNSLTSVTIPASVTVIDNHAFSYCKALKCVEIPSGVRSIGDYAFADCVLTDVYYSGTQDQWNSISVGNHNESLGKAKIHCIGPALVLPASLTTIDTEAFAGSAFSYVKVPDGARYIGNRAFADCPRLRYIYIPAECMICFDAFQGVTGLTIIGISGSPAESFAKSQGYTFLSMDG